MWSDIDDAQTLRRFASRADAAKPAGGVRPFAAPHSHAHLRKRLARKRSCPAPCACFRPSGRRRVKLEAGTARCQSMRGLCGCAVALVGLALVARHAQWLDDFDLFVPTVWAQCLVYALSAFLLLQRWPCRPAMAASFSPSIILVAVILRIVALATPPNFLSTDVYRYVWDGRVQGAGINPYLHVPSDPALASLRDEAIYPHINRLYTAPTIYPPFAQMVFFAVTRFGRERHRDAARHARLRDDGRSRACGAAEAPAACRCIASRFIFGIRSRSGNSPAAPMSTRSCSRCRFSPSSPRCRTGEAFRARCSPPRR